MTQNRFKTTSTQLKMVAVSNFSSKIASHPESKAIISRLLAGESLRSVASQFGLTTATLGRFKQRVIRPAALGQQPSGYPALVDQTSRVIRNSKNVLPALIEQTSTADLVAQKLGRYNRILEKAEKAGELGNWASIDRAETAALQLQAQLRGEVNQVHTQTTVQMMVYTPQVHEAEDVTEVEVIDAAPAFEEVEAPAPLDPVAEVVARLPKMKPPKPPKPPSLFKRLQKLSAADRKQAIRLIGQGLDPFAEAPDLPE